MTSKLNASHNLAIMRKFAFAADRIVETPFGYIRIIVQEREIVTSVIFAEQGTEPLLGATTLKAGHFAVDPIRHRLTPIIPPARYGNGRPIRRA